MTGVLSLAEPNLTVLKHLSQGLLEKTGRSSVHGNLLEIHHPAAPSFDPLFLYSAAGPHAVSISLKQRVQAGACVQGGTVSEQGGCNFRGQRVLCDSAQLPFQDRVFGMVVLHHVVETGEEAELSEAVRVLARTGVLILLGLNRLGWRYRTQDKLRRLPGIAPLRVKARLQALGMTLEGYAGAGLVGRQGPACMTGGLKGLAVPLADMVLVQARHRSGPEVTPLRFRKQRSAVVQSAPMRG